MKSILSFAATCLVAGAAMASGPGGGHGDGTSYLGNGVFTYALFEAAVQHSDLETCPDEFDSDAVFCRLTLAGDMAHVFVFDYEGDQPLLALKSYELTDGILSF